MGSDRTDYPGVTVVQSTQDGSRSDLTRGSWEAAICKSRDFLVDALMRTILVVIGHILLNHSVQLSLSQDQGLIETFPLKAVHKSLAERISPGGSVRGPQFMNSGRSCETREAFSVLAIPIMDQIFRGFPPGGSFAELLSGPRIIG